MAHRYNTRLLSKTPVPQPTPDLDAPPAPLLPSSHLEEMDEVLATAKMGTWGYIYGDPSPDEQDESGEEPRRPDVGDTSTVPLEIPPRYGGWDFMSAESSESADNLRPGRHGGAIDPDSPAGEDSPPLSPDYPDVDSEPNPPEISSSDLSSEYHPSDQPKGPARLRRPAKDSRADRVDSSKINRNERDPVVRQAMQDDQVAYETRKANQAEWLDVLKNLDVLGEGKQLSEKVICNFLLDLWWDLRFSPGMRPLYLPFAEVYSLSRKALSGNQQHLGGFEGGEFNLLYRSTAAGATDKRVCFFLHRNQMAMMRRDRDQQLCGSNHFFPVVFDYGTHKAHAFGILSKKVSEVREEGAKDSWWGCWLGPELWKLIGDQLGWGKDVGDPNTVRVVTKSWLQNGYDCGMYSLEILQRVIRTDRSEELLDMSTLVSFKQCQHPERVNLLLKTAGWIREALQLHRKLDGPPTRLEGFPLIVLTLIQENAFSGIQQFFKVQTNLFQARLTCGPCILQRRQLARDPALDLVGLGLVMTRPKPRQDEEEDDEQNREQGNLSEVDEEEGARLATHRELLGLAGRLGGKVVKGGQERAMRSKPVRPYQFRAPMPEGVVKGFDPYFDCYHSGPTAEMVAEACMEICAAFYANLVVARWSTVHVRFCDLGYRAMAGGFHQFYLNQPSLEDQLEHFFPLPPRDVLNEWRENRGSLPEASIEGNDLEVWTLEKMVGQEAGIRNTERCMKTYVTGRTDSGSLIRLDIPGSRKTVENLVFSADVDSVIWVTDRLKVNGPISLQLLPYKGEKAPIHKHNHTYVNLYWPRTEEDVREGRRSTASQEVPISNLPNTHFAHFGKTEGSGEVIVVFPRMKHKYPLRKVHETKIPWEIEAFWLQHVVYPAVNKLKARGVQPYTHWILADFTYKYGDSREKSLMFSPQQLEEILKAIREILLEQEDDELFAQFGSFFFVLQILGIKISMSTDDDWAGLWQKLVDQHSALDWSYMEDLENGELLVDLGFGIHPRVDAEVVGFWDVEAIQLGFDYGGYARGVRHGVGTLPEIGGIHAEMTRGRRMRTHIAYRLTYNLTYEVLRSHQTRLRNGFFPAKSAYEVDQKYRQDVKGVVEAYNRNLCKSFGVRDEYRCRASAAKRMLPLLKDKAREYVRKLDPIIWLSSLEWFTFAGRRVQEISNVQERLSRFRHRPKNYGVLTSVLTHIMQHVGITPIVKDPDLRLNLSELRFQAVSLRFGCFFLQDLDLTNGNLPEVQKEDQAAMLKRMGIKSTRQAREPALVLELSPAQDGLTWKGLKLHLNKGSEHAKIREFTWDPTWIAYSIARGLFCQFTYDFWIPHTSEAFQGLAEAPATLQDAMEVWTLKSVKERINPYYDICLTPSVDQLRNVPAKSHNQLFGLKRTAFFPEPGEACLNHHWNGFFQAGYVKRYHEAIQSSLDNGKVLRDALDKIFENLQVLPLNPGRPCDKKPLWRWVGLGLELLFNSSYIQLVDRTLRFRGGTLKEKRQGRKHKTRPAAEVAAILVREDRQAPLKKSRAIQRYTTIQTRQLMKNRKKGKPKNHREPPTKGKPGAEPEESMLGELGRDPEGPPRRNPRKFPLWKSCVVESDDEPPIQKGGAQDHDLPAIAYLEEEEEDESDSNGEGGNHDGDEDYYGSEEDDYNGDEDQLDGGEGDCESDKDDYDSDEDGSDSDGDGEGSEEA